MQQSRGIKNILTGVLSQVIILAVGIIIPRLVLVNLGSEANGLLNSVTNILSYMSLLEAGVGTATLQALYKPCAVKDHKSINSIMAATQRFYRRTGIIYFFIVICLSVGYAFFIDSDIPRIDVFCVVLLCGLSGVISYYFQGKFKILLSAEGKRYVNTSITTIIHIAISVSKAILLVLGFGVVAVQVSAFILNIVQMLAYYIYMKRHYKWLNLKEQPDFEAISQRNYVLIHQISGLIFSNTDVLILTVFATLKEVSVYTIYAMIYGMVKAIAVAIYEGYEYALGQAYNTDRNKFLRMFDAFELISIIVSFTMYCICRYMINPFLELYTSGVNDINYIDRWLPWLFAAFYLLHNGRTASGTLIQIAQHFSETKWQTILEAVINLLVSIMCVQLYGIYGVLLGTIAALLYRTNDMIIYAAKLLGRSSWITYRRWILNLVIFIGVSMLLEQFSFPMSNYLLLAISACIVAIITISIFVVINAIIDRKNATYIFSILRNMLRKFSLRLGRRSL